MRFFNLVSESLARMAPINTCMKTFGRTKQVAMKNWSNDTDAMLWREDIRSKPFNI
jgi:hypothetical protein